MRYKIVKEGTHFKGYPIREYKMKRRKISRKASEAFEEEDDYLANLDSEAPQLIPIECDESDLPFELTEEERALNKYREELEAKGLHLTEDGQIVSIANKKEVFEKVYKETEDLSKRERTKRLKEELDLNFKSNKNRDAFIEANMERKERNLSVRIKRFNQKASLNEFNTFITITYDENIMNAEEFRLKLKKMLYNLARRKGWKVLGVFEYSEKERLHFHALGYIPDKSMDDDVEIVSRYSLDKHDRVKIRESKTFRKKFGINEFRLLDREDKEEYEKVKYYLVKYMHKSKTEVVSIGNIKESVVCEIKDEEIICDYNDQGAKIMNPNFKGSNE